jgi:UDP-N-acetylmuramoyl-tripeptide--D-alanyl-D-alanine ligase
MPSFAPSYLASWTGGQWTTPPMATLHGFTQDTRKLQAGQVFVALRTDRRDGHDFLAAAAAAGASAAIVSRPDASRAALPQLVVADPLRALQAIAREHRRAFRGPLIGVTGSCGKTSTKNLLSGLLGGDPHVLSTEGNLNNHIGVPLTLTRLDPTVHEFGVIEAGISAHGEMAELGAMIEPDYGIVTLVAAAHTAELGGLEGVAREKAVLLQHIRPSGLGVFPQQCWEFAAFQDLPQTSIVVVPEGGQAGAARIVTYRLESSGATTRLWLGKRSFDFRRVSRGMAQNAALALTLASEMGVGDDALQRALQHWQPAKWRGELRQEGGRLLYLDFYNANPASMADALENFDSLAPAELPRLYVLGCMEELGPDSPRHHRELGRSLPLRPRDELFLIGSEAESLRAGAAEGGRPAARIEIVDTADAVLPRLRDFQGAVFIKGSRRYELEKALPPSPAPSSAAAPSPSLSGRPGSADPFAGGRGETRSCLTC